jgi:hypothetical protein
VLRPLLTRRALRELQTLGSISFFAIATSACALGAPLGLGGVGADSLLVGFCSFSG